MPVILVTSLSGPLHKLRGNCFLSFSSLTSLHFLTLKYQILISPLGDWGIRSHSLTYFLSFLWDPSIGLPWSGSDSTPHRLEPLKGQYSVNTCSLCILNPWAQWSDPGAYFINCTLMTHSFTSLSLHPPHGTPLKTSGCLLDISEWRQIIRSLSLTKLIWFDRHTSEELPSSYTSSTTRLRASDFCRQI